MLYSIDRFEGDIAVLIDEQEAAHEVPRSLLPEGVDEGDMFRFKDGHYSLDDDATRARREQILRLQNKLRGK